MTDWPRILVIDDDREIVKAVTIRLKAAGYDVTAAYDGEQGLASTERDRPDLIVLDVRMPVMDGLTTLAALQQRDETKAIPVVMISASLGDKRCAIDLGARHFLGKPFDPKELTALIASHVAPRPAREQH